MPFFPDVLGKALRPRFSNIRRSSSALHAQSKIVAPGPGSKSNAIVVGREKSSALESRIWTSKDARLAIQTSEAASSIVQKSTFPGRETRGTEAVFIHFGW